MLNAHTSMSNQNAMHSNVVILQHLRINMKNYHFLFCFQRNEMLHSYLKRETVTESFIGKCERMRANAHRLFTILHFNIANFNCYESCAQRVKQRTEWLGQALTRFGPSNWNSFFFLLYFSIRQALIRFVFTFDSYFSLFESFLFAFRTVCPAPPPPSFARFILK